VSAITISDADASVTISNLTLNGTLAVDAINEKGTNGVAIEGLTLDDGSYTDADGSMTMSNLTANGDVSIAGSLTLTSVGTASNVTAATLDNLPDGSTTNAAFAIIKVGATSYAVPMYEQP
jgi:hypothetical protein